MHERHHRWISKKILLIEGNEFIRSALQYMLEASGMIITAVESGEEGLLSVPHNSFDAVVCSHHLPGIDGLEFFSRARASLSHATTILTAAFAEDYLVNKAYAAGIGVFMEKPFRVESLLACFGGRSSTTLQNFKGSHVYYNNWGERLSIAPSDMDEAPLEMGCIKTPAQKDIHRVRRKWKLYVNNRKLDFSSNLSPPHLELVKRRFR